MELVGTLLLAAIVLGLLIVLFRKDSVHNAKMPPGPTPLPVIGNLLTMNGRAPQESFLKMSETYGPVMTVYLGPQPVVVLVGFEAVHEALVKHADAFAGRATMPLFLRVNKGYGMAFTNGERWRQLRRFSLSTLRDYGMGKRSIEDWILEEANHLVEEFHTKTGHSFDPTLTLSRAVSNVICCIIFGQRFEYEDKDFIHLLSILSTNVRLISRPFAQLYNIFPKLMNIMPGVYNRILENAEQLIKFIKTQVEKHKETLVVDSPRDYIDNFLIRMKQENGNPASEFNLDNLVISISNLFGAGTETTSTTLRFGLLVLIKYPQFQEKIHQEIDSVIGRDRPPSMEDRKNMPFTDAMIHETQRFVDLVPMNVPHATTRETDFRGYTIPANTVVLPLLNSVLFDKTQWQSPLSFNPGHFLDENGQLKVNPAFMPFSTGKRVCTGESLARMELFLFFVALLQKFSFSSTEDPENISLGADTSSFLKVPLLYKLKVSSRS
ncbi:cytochrome P450 2B4-like [Erpetoichthys calabaricus]|uniref:Cytochrome P450 2B4-like n=1 Tax=Erpetoichthys calabaricus TaxID=27687 RepID=A0A8C4RCY6_ERPCA|nr:cytochrome P450 2B4-like [Erpetoichthys calabaricus]